ncbi:MAG: hypothetical protein WCO08_00740, partial [Actinomycetes bacterium]
EIAKTSVNRALQAATIGMSLSMIAMVLAGFGRLTSSVGAGTQEIIDALAVLWALTALRNPRKNRATPLP